MLGYMAYLLWAALSTEPTPSRCVRGLSTGDEGLKVCSACPRAHASVEWP